MNDENVSYFGDMILNLTYILMHTIVMQQYVYIAYVCDVTDVYLTMVRMLRHILWNLIYLAKIDFAQMVAGYAYVREYYEEDNLTMTS